MAAVSGETVGDLVGDFRSNRRCAPHSAADGERSEALAVAGHVWPCRAATELPLPAGSHSRRADYGGVSPEALHASDFFIHKAKRLAWPLGSSRK